MKCMFELGEYLHSFLCKMEFVMKPLVLLLIECDNESGFDDNALSKLVAVIKVGGSVRLEKDAISGE